jgi:hypothetical protein
MKPQYVWYREYSPQEVDVLEDLKAIRDSKCSTLCNSPGPFKDPICVSVDALIIEIERLRTALGTLVGASECFLSSEVVDETGGTIPLMDRLERAIEAARGCIR